MRAAARGELPDALGRRMELFAVSARLLEVVAKDLLELDQAISGSLLDPVRKALMQFSPQLLRNRVVRGVADEVVGEAEVAFATAEAKELLADEREERRCHIARL